MYNFLNGGFLLNLPFIFRFFPWPMLTELWQTRSEFSFGPTLNSRLDYKSKVSQPESSVWGIKFLSKKKKSVGHNILSQLN